MKSIQCFEGDRVFNKPLILDKFFELLLKFIFCYLLAGNLAFGARLNNYGFYSTSHTDRYTMAPYVYTPDPLMFAKYDFAIFQEQGDETANLVKEIKKINPSFKVIICIGQISGSAWPLDYFFDENFRKKEFNKYIIPINKCGVNNIYGVTIGEEELMNTYWGWYDDKIPKWAEKYIDIYKSETRDSNWNWNGHNSNTTYRKWLNEKTIWAYNHLYYSIKNVYPNIKIYPFLYIPGDISGWGWIDPDQIKNDGWIYQWHINVTNSSLNSTQPQYEKQFKDALEKIRKAGVDDDEIYIQVWAFRSIDDIIFQINKLKEYDVKNIFCFFFMAWLPPALPPEIYITNDYNGVYRNGIYWESDAGGHDFAASRREFIRLNKMLEINESEK